MRFTKQKVRSLDYIASPPRPNVARLIRALFCSHTNLIACCDGACGHVHCPNCGLSWDEHAGL